MNIEVEIEYSSKIIVELVDIMATDDAVVEAAKVSTLSDASVFEMTQEAKVGFINFLMANRHGSPFEHAVFKWRIDAPIFMWREFQRHRIASYNEQSGRYTKMPAKFYLPARSRKLIQVGKPGHYTFKEGTDEQYFAVLSAIKNSCLTAYCEYEGLLSIGIAKEVARMALPLNLFSSCYVTMNARALMNFLSLRVKSDDSKYPSFPMWEINHAADQMEKDFATHMPVTHETFVKNGRVQP